MKIALFVAAFCALATAGMSWVASSAFGEGDSTAGSSHRPLTAEVICESPDNAGPAIHGSIEVVKGSEGFADTAVVRDESGTAYSVEGFGLTGETITTVEGREPETQGIERGKALPEDLEQAFLLECSFSSVSTEVRSLTSEDVDELGIDISGIGQVAQVETSVSGTAWISPVPLGAP